MRGKFRIPRPGAAIIIAVIALVFALGGGAIAAKTLRSASGEITSSIFSFS